jgi:hypothetical protein
MVDGVVATVTVVRVADGVGNGDEPVTLITVRVGVAGIVNVGTPGIPPQVLSKAIQVGQKLMKNKEKDI